MARWKQRPEGSTWGDFGEDDELGRLNLLTPQKVLQAIKEVRTGQVFCLSLPLNMPGGNVLNQRRHPPVLSPTFKDGTPYMNMEMGRIQKDAIDVLCDDQVTLSMQYSTQWDGLSHVGAMFDTQGDGKMRKVFYNGFEGGVDILGGDESSGDGGAHEHAGCCEGGGSNALRLSVESYARKGMQGRGVLVDLAEHLGTGRTVVNADMLLNILNDQRIQIDKGDMLVLRTGFSEAIIDMNGQPDHATLEQTGAVLDGSDPALLNWITESGIAAICADNYAVENYPARTSGPGHSILPLHHHCLFKLGVPLAELWYLKDLAQWLHDNQRHHFLLTAPPLRMPGAVGSPVTPIATV
ncbi:cyclase family protein [Orrella marina]|uniref:Cyclase n=1 Tax=Orrella marina TaxID=2163011 RepID=A0A2R4XIY5_9BURK|nr:cyclase family protein [Orrella marina]AWB33776.1 cyclase [Orrella marina]